MSNRRCPKCGEEYSDTYRSCPFCEEEDAIKHGRPLRRRGGRRLEKRQNTNGGAGGVMLLLTGIIILCVVGYVFFGDQVADAVGIRDTQEPPVSSQKEPEPSPAPDVQPDQPNQPADSDENHPSPDVEPAVPDTPSEPTGETAEPGPLTLSQTNITIPAGETGRLTASGGSGGVTWSSSNPEIASVEGGSVTGKAGGTVTITAASGEETATCQVKVEGDPWVDPNPSTYRLSKDDFTLSPSETTWQMKVKKDDGKWEIMGPDQGVAWASNNTSVVTISETGLVTRAGKGTTQITATIGGVTLECTVRMS